MSVCPNDLGPWVYRWHFHARVSKTVTNSLFVFTANNLEIKSNLTACSWAVGLRLATAAVSHPYSTGRRGREEVVLNSWHRLETRNRSNREGIESDESESHNSLQVPHFQEHYKLLSSTDMVNVPVFLFCTGASDSTTRHRNTRCLRQGRRQADPVLRARSTWT